MNLFFASCRLKYVFNLFSEMFLNKSEPGIVKTIVDNKYPPGSLPDIIVGHESAYGLLFFRYGMVKQDFLIR